MRKRILAVMLCCFMTVGVCACGETTDTVKETKVTEEAESTEEVKASEEEVSESVEIEGKVLKQLTEYSERVTDIYEYDSSEVTITNKDLLLYIVSFYLYDDIFYTRVGYEKLNISEGGNEEDLGMLSKHSYYWDGTLDTCEEYMYDEKGDLVTYYTGHGDSIEYTYDEGGNLLTKAKYGDGGIESSVEYEYDSKENLSKETYYTGSENQVNYWYTYSYDGEGNLLEVTYYDTSSTYTKCKYEYDEVGNLIKEVTYHSDNSTSIGEYEYDTDGKILKAIRYENGEYDESVEYEYDESGNITEVRYYSDTPDTAWGVGKFVYDEKGNCLSFISEEDNSQTKGEFEYDEAGYLIKYTERNYDKDSNSWEEYEDSICFEYYD